MKIEQNNSDGKKQIDGDFSQEFYLNKQEVSDLLRELADEIEQGNELTISSEEWELPFKFRNEIEVEIDKDYDELEIELEFDQMEEGDLSVG